MALQVLDSLKQIVSQYHPLSTHLLHPSKGVLPQPPGHEEFREGLG